jgi:hypothetical protein
VFGSDDKADCPHKTLLAMMFADWECYLMFCWLLCVRFVVGGTEQEASYL